MLTFVRKRGAKFFCFFFGVGRSKGGQPFAAGPVSLPDPLALLCSFTDPTARAVAWCLISSGAVPISKCPLSLPAPLLQKDSHQGCSSQELPWKWAKTEFGPTLTLVVSSSPLSFAGGIQASLCCSNLSIYGWQAAQPRRLSASNRNSLCLEKN